MHQKPRVTTTQREALMTLLEANYDDITASSRHRRYNAWAKITEQLNGGEINSHNWQMTWRDWKSNTKKKVLKRIEEMNSGLKVCPLTPLEHRTLVLIGVASPQSTPDTVLGEISKSPHIVDFIAPSKKEIQDKLQVILEEGPISWQGPEQSDDVDSSPEKERSSSDKSDPLQNPVPKPASPFYYEKPRMNAEQRLILINFLEENYHLLSRKGEISAPAKKQAWLKVVPQLNIVGSQKTLGEWQRTLMDYRNNVKKKVLRLLQEKNKGKRVLPLTSIEHRMMVITGAASPQSTPETVLDELMDNDNSPSPRANSRMTPMYTEGVTMDSSNFSAEGESCSWQAPPLDAQEFVETTGARCTDPLQSAKRKAVEPLPGRIKRSRSTEEQEQASAREGALDERPWASEGGLGERPRASEVGLEERWLRLRERETEIEARRLEMERCRVAIWDKMAAVCERAVNMAEKFMERR